MSLIKKVLKKFIYLTFRLVPLRNHIIFESHPDLSGNTFPVFKLMIKEKLNEKYKFVWYVNDFISYQDYKIQNVFFKNINPKNLFERIILFFNTATAKCIITENRFISKKNNNQFVIYLTHGTVLKDVTNKIVIGPNCDFTLYQSEFTKQITANMLQINSDKMVCLGFPRNDYLFKENKLVKQMFEQIVNKLEFSKIIIWMPTFRQHKNKSRIDSNVLFPLGLPIIENMEQISKLNHYLKDRNILLVLKPHPAQDLSYIKTGSHSNILLLYDNDLNKYNLQLYEVIGNTDALITDYSSLYFDYLLKNKPIGLTIDDIEEYRSTLGFAYENILDILKGEYIRGFNDLLSFIENISKGIDVAKVEREMIKNLMNHYQDNCSTRRVYDFILTKARL
jgi:CDP-glycerol glycerophosphotransferase